MKYLRGSRQGRKAGAERNFPKTWRRERINECSREKLSSSSSSPSLIKANKQQKQGAEGGERSLEEGRDLTT